MADSFKCTLKLKGKGGELLVKCGNISHINMSVFSYGFQGNVSFVVDKEEKLDFFYEPAIIEVTLTVQSGFAEESVKPLEFQGIVTNKTIFNESRDGTAPDVVEKRECGIEFCDPAAAIWSKHFPVQLFTQKSMEDVVNGYLSKPISIQFDSPSLKEQKPLIALGLGGPKNDVNFYKFLMWHCNNEGSIWGYDYEKKQYTVRDEKKSDGEPIDLPYDSGRVSVVWPELSRHDIRVVNSYAAGPTTHDVKGEEVFEGVKRDILFTTPLAGEAEKKSQSVKPKPKTFEHQLQISFDHFPEKSLFPGTLYTFKAPEWGKALYQKKGTYRIHSFKLIMNGTENPFVKGSPPEEQKYDFSLIGFFELKEEVFVQRPPLRVPTYPFALEGKIFSEVGDEKELTFDIGQDEKSSQYYYTVEIPWADNQKITVPFEPTFMSGQMYSPLLKGQRVVVEFSLFAAKIVEVKDWFGSAQLPHKTQGNRMVFSPRNEDKAYTFLEHTKGDDGTLSFIIERKSEKQLQRVQIKEDGLHIGVQKDGEEELQCHVWMDNEKGITITSQDKQSEETQTVTLKPQEVSVSCAKGEDKSVMKLTPTSITIDCQEFNLNAKTTNLTSEEEAHLKGKTLTLEGEQGITIDDQAKVDIKSVAVSIG